MRNQNSNNTVRDFLKKNPNQEQHNNSSENPRTQQQTHKAKFLRKTLES